jgi:hypothetical protein
MSAHLHDAAKSWLEALECEFRSVEDPQMEWHLEVKYPARRSDHVMHVAGVRGSLPSIAIASVTRLSDRHLQRFAGLPDDEKKVFLFGLRHTLNSPDVDFELKGADGGLSCPTAFQVSVRRFEDGLSADEFARSIGAVYKVELSAIWFIQETLEQEPTGPTVMFDFEGQDIPEA